MEETEYFTGKWLMGSGREEMVNGYWLIVVIVVMVVMVTGCWFLVNGE